MQSASGFSQVSSCPLLNPHQAHLPKHQGIVEINFLACFSFLQDNVHLILLFRLAEPNCCLYVLQFLFI